MTGTLIVFIAVGVTIPPTVWRITDATPKYIRGIPQMSRADKLPYNHVIGQRVKEMTRDGVPVSTIFASIQSYQDAPGSLSTFYKNYRLDMESARAEAVGQIGNKVVNQALNGDDEHPNTWKAREFYLRTQGGWSPKETVETREVGSEDEEDTSAVEALMAALGKGTEDTD